MAETLTVTVDDGAAYDVDVRSVVLFSDSGLTSPVTFPQSVSTTTTWYAAAASKPGARDNIEVLVTAANGATVPVVTFTSLPATVELPEGKVDFSAPTGGSLPVPSPDNALQVLRVTAEGDGYELAAPSAGGLAVQPGDADFTTAIGDEGTVNIGDGGAPLLASKMTDDPHDRYQLWPDGNMFGGDGSADPSGLANIFPTNSGAGRYGWTVTGELHIQGASGTGDGNLYVEGVGNGIILKDPNGDPWLVTVGTDGTLATTSL